MNQEGKRLEEYLVEVKFVGSFDGPLPEGTLLVESDAGYVRAVGSIRKAFAGQSPLRVWVRKRPHYSWLQSYSNMTNCHCDFGEMTSRHILADSWQTSIPDWLTDQMVEGNSLLNLKLSESHPDNFVDAYISHFLGNTFAKSSIAVEDIPALVASAKQEKHQIFEKYKLLNRCLEEKCRQWAAGALQPWVGDFCDLLLNKPEELRHDLSLYVLLHGYPDKLLEYEVVPSRAIILRKIPPEKLTNLEFDSVAVEKASNQIDIFFNDVKEEVQSSSDVIKLTHCCSGSLIREFKNIRQLLEKAAFPVETELLEKIRAKFKTCSGVGTSDLLSLERFVIPKKPVKPAEGEVWDAAKWLSWAVDEYIPFRHWQTNSGDVDPDLEETVEGFTDWYVDNFVSVHQDQQLSLAHVLTTWKDRIAKDTHSLVLIVDCLPLTFFPLLLKAFSMYGLHKHEQGYRFSPLPSNTDVSKTLLLSGDWYSEKNEDYAAISAKRVALEWPTKKSVYLPGLHALTEMANPEQSSVIVLNYTPSDQVMHGDPQLKGMTHEEELLRCFEKLADALRNFYQRLKTDEQAACSIYVVTDHGATRILDDEKKSLESSVVKNLFVNEKHRFAYVDKGVEDNVPDNLWNFGYRFKRQFGADERIYFIPRGHNTVGSGTGKKGYTHGGASPEEIVVPVAVFKPVESKWQEPKARFVNLRIDSDSKRAVYHIQRMVSVELTIQNANPEPLQLLRVEIAEPENSQVKEFKTQILAANSENNIEVKCYFDKSAQGQKEMQFRFIYRYGENERELVLSLDADFKSAMTGGFRLRNL